MYRTLEIKKIITAKEGDKPFENRKYVLIVIEAVIINIHFYNEQIKERYHCLWWSNRQVEKWKKKGIITSFRNEKRLSELR